MGFFRKLLGREPATTIPIPAPARAGTPAAGIAHDPRLIDSLLDGHSRLGTLYDQIGTAARTGRIDETRRLLGLFKSGLEAHVLTENVRFYTYLEQSIQGDPQNAEIMRSFRRDMNDIVRQIVRFVKKHQEDGPFDAAAFEIDHAAVGVLLERRLDSEESQLYPMYKAS